jgi:formamidopyrimidine-DNA glycosylase
VTEEEWEGLWRTMRKLMRRGVTQAEIRTVAAAEPSAHPLSGRGPHDSFYVYQQEVCRRCGSPINEFPLSARRMFACPQCQPRGRRRRKTPTRLR